MYSLCLNSGIPVNIMIEKQSDHEDALLTDFEWTGHRSRFKMVKHDSCDQRETGLCTRPRGSNHMPASYDKTGHIHEN